MTKSTQYTHETGSADYRHGFHAGNVGDVWKHTVLGSLISVLIKKPEPLLALDCHAGDGLYPLGATGEWTEGIGKLGADYSAKAPALLRYLAWVKAVRGARREYPGSPILFARMLRNSDSIICCEIGEEIFETLGKNLSGDERVKLYNQDGVAKIQEIVAETPKETNLLLHVDAPWNAKADWTTIPQALLAACRARPETYAALWYPIKSYTRVSAMMKMLRAEKLSATIVELITTPLEFKRNRLNGSGMLLVNSPTEVLAEVSEAAVEIAERCKTSSGRWEFRVDRW